MSELERPLVIPPPRADRPPLRTNLFNHMQKANTTLAPLFPYLHRGAIVPTGALFVGGPGKDWGQFYHHNSVDEVIIAFVTEGSTMQTGLLYNGGRMHGVNSFLKDPTKAGSFALFTITQRQLDEGSQPEAVTLNCSKCNKQVFKCEWDGASMAEGHELAAPFPGASAPGWLIARDYNEDPAQRTCGHCGHVNDRFPVSSWGWDAYGERSLTMREARRMLVDAAAPAEPARQAS
jgi:hypothetical protein